MKICGISDIHGQFIDIPECDVLCIAGDLINLNDQRNIDTSRHWWYNRFTSWVNQLPCKKVIIIPGNHDMYIEDAYKKGYLSQLKQDLNIRTNGKLVILVNEQYDYEGTKFYGCPYINPIPFQQGRWAFENDSITNEETGEVTSKYDDIPDNIDILITHDNPFKNALLSNTPKAKIAHLYGHWHDGRDLPEVGYYNCSLLDDFYNVKKNFKPIIIDTDEFVSEDIQESKGESERSLDETKV